MSRVVGFEQNLVTEKYYEQLTANIFLPEGFESRFSVLTPSPRRPTSESSYIYDHESARESNRRPRPGCKPEKCIEIEVKTAASSESFASSFDSARDESYVIVDDNTDLQQHMTVRLLRTLCTSRSVWLTHAGCEWETSDVVSSLLLSRDLVFRTDRASAISNKNILTVLSRSLGRFSRRCYRTVASSLSSRTLFCISDAKIRRLRWCRQNSKSGSCLRNVMSASLAGLVCETSASLSDSS